MIRHSNNTAIMPRELSRFSEDKKPVVMWNTNSGFSLPCIHCHTESKDQDYPIKLPRPRGGDTH